MPVSLPPVLACARSYAQAGLSVMPILPCNRCKNPAKGKEPALSTWKRYQIELPIADEVDYWFGDGQHGIAILCGQISGGLEVIDFEDGALFEQWRERVEGETPGLLARLPVVRTPRPGRHVYYRSDRFEGSKKLARTADGQTLIERRGEGGYVLAPGSPASCHPSGRCYEHVSGPLLTATPQITPQERELLLGAARSFNASAKAKVRDNQEGGSRPQQAATLSQPAGADAVKRATAFARTCAVQSPAISGQGGHDQTFKVTCALVHGFHLDDDTTYSLLLNEYNPRCVPPWSEKELRHKVESARKQGSYRDMLNESHTPINPSANGKASGDGINDSSPKAPRGGGIIWNPLPISQLKRIAPPDSWVWEGILAPGKITLLSAEAKAGKTTLLSLLYQRMTTGGNLCGATVSAGRVIVVSEEPADIWLDRRECLALGDHLEILSMPFVTKPTQHEWERMIGQAVQALEQHPANLVVWDTLSHLWWVADENDNAKEAAALMPLRQLCESGASLALVHHFGAERNGPRGGTELRGFPDVLADLHLYKQGEFVNRRRILKIRGRLNAAPSQLVMELNAAGDDYFIIEGAIESGLPTLWAVLQTLIPSQPPGWSAQEFRQHWPSSPAPEQKRLLPVVADNWQSAGWQRSGEGKKNDPYRYWLPEPPQLIPPH
jgi:hypothetical protein